MVVIRLNSLEFRIICNKYIRLLLIYEYLYINTLLLNMKYDNKYDNI